MPQLNLNSKFKLILSLSFIKCIDNQKNNE